MADNQDGAVSNGWAYAGPTLVSIAALVGLVYWCDRTYRRWLKENHPLAEHRARFQRLTTDYRRRRANVTEVGRFIADLVVEVTRAPST